MEELGTVTADEMVLAFLRAEIDSPRFANEHVPVLRERLRQSGLDPSSLIDEADLGDLQTNAQRRDILRWWRGYPDSPPVFAGMPDDVTWRRVRLQPEEVGRIRYCNHPTWLTLSGDGRLVADGAANLGRLAAPDRVDEHVARVADLVRQGKAFPEIILVQAQDGELIILEGHTRATAYMAANIQEPIEALVGTSLYISQWALHG